MSLYRSYPELPLATAGTRAQGINEPVSGIREAPWKRETGVDCQVETVWGTPRPSIISPVVEWTAETVGVPATLGEWVAGVADATQDRVQGDAAVTNPLSLRTNLAAAKHAETMRGVATWVHPSLAGNLMADNATVYDPQASGLAAATSWPIGTVLEVRGPTGRSMMLEVRDTGLLPASHLDLSESDFMVLAGDLRLGVATVEIRVLP